jgi:hypothetical protein
MTEELNKALDKTLNELTKEELIKLVKELMDSNLHQKGPRKKNT